VGFELPAWEYNFANHPQIKIINVIVFGIIVIVLFVINILNNNNIIIIIIIVVCCYY